jgi:hypothetical protein
MIWLGVHRTIEYAINKSSRIAKAQHVVVQPLPLPASVLLLQLSMQVHISNAFSIRAWLFTSLCQMCVSRYREAERTHNGKY